MKRLIIIAFFGTIFLSPDQQGQRLMKQEEYVRAASVFTDPMRVGVAWYRAGEFKKAESIFRELATPEAIYNRGNCQIFLGQYDAAIKSYSRALELKPDWEAAVVNREIARIRAATVETKGGDMGDQLIGADEIRFEAGKNKAGQDTEAEEDQPLSNQDMQSLWLRRVQTNPADFIKAKFSYQQAMRDGDGNE